MTEEPESHTRRVKPLQILAVVCGVLVFALYVAATVFMWQSPIPTTSRNTKFSVRLNESGQHIARDVTDSAVIDELIKYFNTPGVERGYWDLGDYVPNLIVECDCAQFNFGGGKVIVATRAKPHEAFGQRSRSKTPGDERLETIVRTWLAHSTSAAAK